MLPFPFSLLLLPGAALLGVVYVSLERVRSPALRTAARLVILAGTWASPLATRGPGAAQLGIGLLVGFLGIRMVALRERWRLNGMPPAPATIFAAMLTPDALMAPAPQRVTTPAHDLIHGLAAAALCVGLLGAGNWLRLWRWSRALDDLLVFVEVAIGSTAVHHLIVAVAGLAGWSVVGLQDRPILSASFCQFWARRWNRLVQSNLDRAFFRPQGRRRRAALGTVAAFTASGIMHVIAVLDAERPALTRLPAAAVMVFFLIHAALVLMERRLGWQRQPHQPARLLRARVRTVGLFVLLSPLLLDPFASVVHVHGRSLATPPGSQPIKTPRTRPPVPPRPAGNQ